MTEGWFRVEDDNTAPVSEEVAPESRFLEAEAEREELRVLAEQAHALLGHLSKMSARAGLGSGRRWGPRENPTNDATSAALFVAWRATQELCALYTPHREAAARFHGALFTKAKNILRGGNAAAASGDMKALAVGIATQTLVGIVPRMSPGDAAEFLCAGYAEAFGSAFERIAVARVAENIGAAQAETDRDCSKEGAIVQGDGVMKIGSDDLYASVRRRAGRLATATIWAAYEQALAEGVENDEQHFRYPMESKRDRETLRRSLAK